MLLKVLNGGRAVYLSTTSQARADLSAYWRGHYSHQSAWTALASGSAALFPIVLASQLPLMTWFLVQLLWLITTWAISQLLSEPRASTMRQIKVQSPQKCCCRIYFAEKNESSCKRYHFKVQSSSAKQEIRHQQVRPKLPREQDAAAERFWTIYQGYSSHSVEQEAIWQREWD